MIPPVEVPRSERSGLTIRTFGGLSVSVAGAAVALTTRKAGALLVYLALADGRACRREHLAHLLWPDVPDARARHSLSQTIYEVRSVVPPDSLVVTGGEVRLVADRCEVDALHFDRWVAEGRLGEAADLYAGEFLEGFWVRGAAPFEEWQEQRRAHYRARVREVLAQLLVEAEMHGLWDRAEELAARLLQLDPLDDEVHRTKIRVIAARGDYRRAVSEYHAARRMLASELESVRLDAPPTPTVDFGGDWSPDAGPADFPDDPVTVPFAGRGAEMMELRRIWDRVRRKAGATVIVHGEAGIGKSRLCMNFLRVAAIQGGRILSGRCYAAEYRLPYGGLVEALISGVKPGDMRRLTPAWAAVLAELLPELTEESGTPHAVESKLLRPDAHFARRRLYEGIARLLEAIGETQPVVLFIDDYHWADESTRGVIQYLARRLAWTPTLLLLATRSSGSQAAELGPFRGMAGVAAIHEVKLKGLPEAATRQIISWFADRFSLDLGPEAYGYLFAHTRGHPFFLIEVMKAVGERSIDVDRLVARGRGRAPGGELLPGSVEDYVRRRGAELAPAAQECLAVLAVLGPDASIATLREVCGWSEPQLRTALEELVRVGFVDLDGEDVGFTHDLIREAAYRSLTGARRRMLHGSVARALMRRSDASSGSIAMHLELAGEGGSAHGYAVRAIEHYRRVHAYDEADYFYRMAIGTSGAEEARRALEAEYGEFLFRTRRYAEAETLLSRPHEEYEKSGDPRGMLSTGVQRLAIRIKQGAAPAESLCRELERMAELAERLEDVESLVTVNVQLLHAAHDAGLERVILEGIERAREIGSRLPASRPKIEALTAAATMTGLYVDVEAGLELADRAVREAEALGDDGCVVTALVARVGNLLQAGMLGPAAADLDRALGICERSALIEHRYGILSNYAVQLIESGDHARAEEMLAAAANIAEEAGANRELLFIHANLAILQWERGRIEDVDRTARRALERARVAGAWWHSMTMHGLIGLCSVAKGRLAEAMACRREILKIRSRHARRVTDQSYTEMFLARLAAWEGETETAVRGLEQAIAEYARRDVLCRLRLQLELAELLADADPGRAIGLVEETMGRAGALGALPIVRRAELVKAHLRGAHIS